MRSGNEERASGSRPGHTGSRHRRSSHGRSSCRQGLRRVPGTNVIGVAMSAALLLAFSAAAASAACPPVPASNGLLAAGKVVVLGEQHGTEESPAFVLDLACRAIEARLPLRVGLELTDSEQARFDAFLASSGDAASRQALLAGEVWTAEPQYGVTSRAMLGLLDGLRRLRAGGGDVAVVLFNRTPETGGGPQRDREMADYLATVATASPQALLLVLTGNYHSRLVQGAPWDESYEPMARLLATTLAAGRLVTLDVAHTGGTAWVCLSGEEGCGSRQLKGRGPAGERGVVFNHSPEENGHDGWYRVGAIHASPPAAAAEGGGATTESDQADRFESPPAQASSPSPVASSRSIMFLTRPRRSAMLVRSTNPLVWEGRSGLSR